jgi:hypothetical protein
MGIKRRTLLFVLIAEEMFFGEHALMQNTRNQYAAAIFEIEHDVHSVLEATQSEAQVFADATQRRIVCERLATNL